MSSFKSSENIQKKEGGSDRYVSDNQSLSSMTLWSMYQGNIYLLLIKQSRYGKLQWLIKGHNPNFDTTKAKLPYRSESQILFMPGSFEFKLTEVFNIALHSALRNNVRAYCNISLL